MFLIPDLVRMQATLGKYAGGAGGADAAQKLFVKNYSY
jgi:hypothetical protein